MKKFVLRDSGVLAVTLLLLAVQPDSLVLQICLGLLLGLCAYLFHEWAHLVGARLTGATLTYPDSMASPFLFSFDSENNSVRQFLHMTWPGFLATAMYITIFYWLLPEGETWADIAWVMAVVLATATLVIEGPIALWIVFGKTVPPVEIPLIGNNRVVSSLINRMKGQP